MMFKAADLSNFYGTQEYFRHSLCRDLVMTDGAHYLCQNGAGWLIDAIASHQSPAVRKACDGFQSWTLKSNGKGGATLLCTDGNSKSPIVKQEIEYTDFPFVECGADGSDGFSMYCEHGSVGGKACWILMLTGER